MEFLQRALREALDRNAAETVRWTKYKEQHEEAKANIKEFTKSLEVDVMVPVGSKALMPGRLYHTNEIVVSHSSTYYSKCTAHKALEICQNRLNVAESRLKALEVEASLHKNQLELPLDFDAFSSQEIIETYDEEEEKKWQVNHKKKMKEQKQKEAIERQQLLSGKAEGDVIKMLEELELMEELEDELEAISEEDDEAVQAILSERPEQVSFKKRISHLNDRKMEGVEPSMKNGGSIEQFSLPPNSSDDDDEEDDDDDDDIPTEIKELERKTASMTNREKTKLFRVKLDEVQNYLETLKPRTLEDISHKTDMMFVSDHLLHAIEMLEDEFNCDRYLNAEITEDSGPPTVLCVPKKTILKIRSPSTKKVSFASEDDVMSYDVLEEPSKISSTVVNDRGPILNLNFNHSEADNAITERTDSIASPTALPAGLPKQTILKKRTSAPKKITFAAEDDVMSYDVLEEPSKISSTVIYDRGPVLHLNINHSEAVFHETNEQSDVIRSPIDIYKQFANCSTIESKKESKGSVVEAKESSNQPTSQRIKHQPAVRPTPEEIKEVPAVENIVEAKAEVKNMLDNMFGIKITNEPKPDPLPEGDFVDSHAPKKRVSLFKQRRQMKSQ